MSAAADEHLARQPLDPEPPDDLTDQTPAEQAAILAEVDAETAAEQAPSLYGQGYDAALDDISILLAEEVERLTAQWDDRIQNEKRIVGLRRALAIVTEARA